MVIGIGDATELVRIGIAHVLSKRLSAYELKICVTEEEVIFLTSNVGLDILVVDQTLSRNPARFITRLLNIEPSLRILIHSPTQELRYAMTAMRAGAKGYITKSCSIEIFVEAVEKVLSGRPYISAHISEQLAFMSCDIAIENQPHTALSARERQIFDMLVIGNPVTCIAKNLGLSTKTVSAHKSRILERMQMSNMSELIQYAVSADLIPKVPILKRTSTRIN